MQNYFVVQKLNKENTKLDNILNNQNSNIENNIISNLGTNYDKSSSTDTYSYSE